MRQRRPGVVLAAAILSIVIGALGLLCGLCGLASNMLLLTFLGNAGPGNAQAAPVADMMQALEKNVPAYRAVEIAKPSLVIVLACVALLAGLGLLKMKGWARTLTILYAVATILLHLGYAAYEIGLVLPAIQAWQNDFLRQQGARVAPPPSNFAATSAGVVLGVFLYVGHAVVVLILLLLPGVSAAFAAAGRPAGRHDDEDEDDELSEPGRVSRRRRRREDDEESDEDDDRVYRRDRD